MDKNSEYARKVVIDIRNDINKSIDIHRKLLEKEKDESKKQFLRGCVAGLMSSLVKLPLIETL